MVVRRAGEVFAGPGSSVDGARILLLGVAYNPGHPDGDVAWLADAPAVLDTT